MKQAHEIANSLLSNRSSRLSPTESETQDSTSKNRLSESLLDNFWLRMAGMFGHTWTSAYGPKPHGIGGDTWAAALSGISGSQIAEGLRATLALGGEFPPSAPKFRAMCLGIPPISQIRVELRGGEPSGFARLVWQRMDAYRWRAATEDKADVLLRDAYDLARDAVMRGEPIPAMDEARIAAEPKDEKPKPADPEVVRAKLAEIASQVGA
jgi:hypothetical protein